MNNRFKHLTSGTDLITVLKGCKKCFKTIAHGKHVVPHKALPFININLKKTGFLVNSCNSPSQIGHWFTLLFSSSRIAFLCDGLNYVQKRPDVMQNIITLCQKHNYKLFILDVRCQLQKSSVCGYIAMYMIYVYTHFSVKQLCSLQKLFKRNGIATNQKIVLDCVKKHFRISF